MPIESLTPLRYVIRSEQSAANDRYVLDPHVRISLALDPTFVAAIQQLGCGGCRRWAGGGVSNHRSPIQQQSFGSRHERVARIA